MHTGRRAASAMLAARRPPDSEASAVPASQLFIVSAPSGAGKTSLLAALKERVPALRVAVSHTTRPPRAGEVDGRDYHFVSHEAFQRLLAQDRFLEHAEVFGNFYGTARDELDDAPAGSLVALEIDWQGAQQVRRKVPAARSLFILPPSRDDLRRRLEGRGKDSPEVIAGRLRKATEEMRHYGEFDTVIINDDFEGALDNMRRFFEHQPLAANAADRVAGALPKLGLDSA